MKGLVCKLVSTKKCEKNDYYKTKERIDVDEPLWDQKYYYGRWRHFAFITDIRTIFVSEEKLWKAKELCELYRKKKEPIDTKKSDIIWAKKLRDSSFNTDTGKPMNIIGRISFQIPGNIFLTAGILTYYKTARSMIIWQCLNQAFNTIVNYNRNTQHNTPTDIETIKMSFVAATVASCTVAICFKRFITFRGSSIDESRHKWGPFFAVVVGNAVNLPIMRKQEIEKGIPLFITNDKTNNEKIISSKIAALKAISECLFSRTILAAPGMLIVPEIIKRLKIQYPYRTLPWMLPPTEALIIKIFLLFMLPSAMAIYPQIHSLNTKVLRLRAKEYSEIEKIFKNEKPKRLYYNKGF